MWGGLPGAPPWLSPPRTPGQLEACSFQGMPSEPGPRGGQGSPKWKPTPPHPMALQRPNFSHELKMKLSFKLKNTRTHTLTQKYNPTSQLIPPLEYKYKVRTESSPSTPHPEEPRNPWGISSACISSIHTFLRRKKLYSQNGTMGLELVFCLNSPPRMSFWLRTGVQTPSAVRQDGFPCSVTLEFSHASPVARTGCWIVSEY